MEIRVLGCSGGIGGQGRRTTSLLVDEDVLVDCGTGVGDLALDALLRINHVFLTHSHLDHIALLPMLVDSVAEHRSSPIVVYGLPETLAALRTHVFNWLIWPDYSRLPSAEKPALRMQEIQIGDVLDLTGRRFEALPANHAVPALGYCLASDQASLAFSGDTAFSAALLASLNRRKDLRYLLLETAFPNERNELAQTSGHLSPAELARLLAGLRGRPELYVTHLKPLFEQSICKELAALALPIALQMLDQGQVFVV